MLGIIELIFSIIGIYGFFTQNLIYTVIGLVSIIICDFIDIFIIGHNPTTIFLVTLLAIGASICNKNPLYTFTIALCGENLIMTICSLPFIIMGLIKFFKGKMQKNNKIREKNIENNKYKELANIIMKGLEVYTIDEALIKTYNFYKEQGLDVNSIEFDKDNKEKTLSKFVMLGLGTNNIDETIEKITEFYENQGIDIKK